MIKIKNIENGEMMQVWQTGIDKATGKIYCNGTPTAKYLAKYPLTATDEKIGEDTVLTLNDGWQVIKGRTPKPSSPKPVQPVVATEETIVAENAAEVLEPLTNTEAPVIEDSEVIEETAVVEAPVVDTLNTDNNTEAEAPVEKPKKKNACHVCRMNYIDPEINDRLNKKCSLSNEDVLKAIQFYEMRCKVIGG